MKTQARLLLSVLLLGPTMALVGGSPAQALSYPAQFAYFPKCTALDQEFCIETFEVTLDSDGIKQTIADPVNNTGPYVSVFISGDYSGPTGATQMGGMFPSLSINYNKTGAFRELGNTSTLDGIDAGKYRTVVRLGDYDPSYLLLSGENVEYSVTEDGDGTFTVDLTARPKPYAGVVTMNLPGGGTDDSVMKSCQKNNWLSSCESNNPYRSYLLTSFVMAGDAVQREALRGTWLSTNASTFSMGTVDFNTGQFGVSVAGPHFLPTDFGLPGTSTENGRQVAPAFFKMFMKYETLADVLKKVMGVPVTVDQVKAFLAQPADVLAGTIEKMAGKTVAETAQALTFDTTWDSDGVVVDFGITHYSAPNPRLTVGRSNKRLTNGGVVRPLTRAAKGKTYNSKAMFSPASGTGVSKVTSSTTKICKTVGTSVRMLKPGTCKLKVTASKSRKSASTTVSIKVS